MAKKYILRSFNPGKKEHNKVNALINLSALGLNAQQSVIKQSIAKGASETSLNNNYSQTLYPYDEDILTTPFQKYKDVTKTHSNSYAYFDLSYPQRVEYLRQFSQHRMIDHVLQVICDESIVCDTNGYFAYLDTDRLRTNINSNSEYAGSIINDCDKAFKQVYSMFGWDKNMGAWHMYKKFLIEGYLAFEIIYNDLENPKDIIGFKYLDPATLEPAIELTSDGREIKVWYQNRGESDQRMIPDTNMIYISWPSDMIGDSSRVSYLEGLTRSYNMLSQIENSRLIWNIQNAQKRVKVIVPVGELSPFKADTLMNEIKAEWNEETYVDDVSGELVVNGIPKFSFTKTYFFPQRSAGNVTLEEMGVEGYDLSSIEPIKYFWRRFILETQLPPNRFMIDPSADSNHPLTSDDSNITREEYQFSRFINRIRAIFREILLKPVWIQICLWHPKLAKSEYLKQSLGIIYNEENIFTEAKERVMLKQQADIVSTLAQMVDSHNQPIFSTEFLVKKFLHFSDDDYALNKKYLEGEIIEQIEKAKKIKDHKQWIADHQQEQAPQPGQDENGGGATMPNMDFGGGGGGDFGGGGEAGPGPEDFGDIGGGGDAGGDFA